MNLLKRLSTHRLLKSCWKKIYIKKSKKIRRLSKGIDGISLQDFNKNKDKNIDEIVSCLRKTDYEFQPIKCSTRKKDNNEHRIISEPAVRDRLVHRAILKVINPLIYPHINTGVSYCGIKRDIDKKEKTEANIKNAIEVLLKYIKKGNFWIFESDIKGFFDNVLKEQMYEKIRDILHPDQSINELIKQIIYYDIGNKKDLVKKGIELPSDIEGLAQGSSLSPLFANLYLSNFDNEMKNKFRDRFIRYVDDFIVVCKTEEEADEAKDLSVKILGEEGLTLSEDKNKTRTVNLSHNGYIKFLGLKIDKYKIQPKKSPGQIINWLKKDVLKKKAYEIRIITNDKGKIIKKVPIIEQMNEVIRGWGNFYKFYHVKKHFNEIDKFLEKFAEPDKIRPFYKELMSLRKIKTNPIISEEEWKLCFK